MRVRGECICNPRFIPIPGLVSIHQVDNVVKGVKERRDLDVAEARELKELMEESWTK